MYSRGGNAYRQQQPSYDGQQQPPYTSQSSYDGQKQPPYTSQSSYDGQKQLPYTSQSSYDGQKQPPYTSQSSYDGQKQPRYSSQSSYDGQKQPPYTSQSSYDGQKQPPYTSQSSYGSQNLGHSYASNSVGEHDGSPQLPTSSSRHLPILGGYRDHTSLGAHYGGQYSGHRASSLSANVSGPSGIQGRGAYGSAIPDSPKFNPSEYIPSSTHGYTHKSEKMFTEKVSDYSSMDRHRYSEQEPRYAGRARHRQHQQQLDIFDLVDKEQLPYEGASRQADYLAAKGSTTYSPVEFLPYGGRVDNDVRNMSMLSSSSILGTGPRRNADDLPYVPTSLTPGYDYELDFPSTKLSHNFHSRIDDRDDDKIAYSHELHREIARWEYEHRRGRLRKRGKARERDRLWAREYRRKREKERERTVERREKERDRVRERTPTRTSKERPGLRKDMKLPRRDSPDREALHRLHSPVKEKEREYFCKIFPSRLVDVERDYLSLEKRYPRLFISPECSKVYVNWPNKALSLPLHTPVSFEHGFADENAVVPNGTPTKLSAGEDVKAERRSIVWNAKIILMSGLSNNSLDEFSSERTYNDRVPHFCNMLSFVVLKRDQLMYTIGGPWHPVDGGNPSVDESALVRTILRYARDQSQLDLSNCQQWNRFLEIHYDRVGSDGLFSHKEITVLFVPDLSNCLPSIEVWREQWLAFKKVTSERNLITAPKKEKPKQKNNRQKAKKQVIVKQVKKKIIKRKAKLKAVDKDGGGSTTKQVTLQDEKDAGKKAESLQLDAMNEPSKLSEDNVKDDTGPTVTPGGAPVKTTKKKRVIRVVKRKRKRKALRGEDTEKVAITKDDDNAATIEGRSIEKQKASDKEHTVDKNERPKEKEKVKKEMKREKDGKDKTNGKSIREVSQKKRLEESPCHPGFIIQTKGSKDSKLRSISLSLDSLLAYTEKDSEESTFELSLFAETLNEMLQYQMGSRILLFLQQLRVKFMKKRCQGKRQREESSKDIDEKSSEKRRKTDESKPAKVDADGAVQMDDKTAPKDTTLIDNIKGNSEEDPEQCDDLKKDPEVPEEDGETVEDNGENNLSNKEDAEVLMKSEDSVVKLEPFDNLIDEAGISTENQDIKPLLHSSNNKKENVVDDVKPEEVVDNEREEREKESPEEKLSKHSQIENQASKKKMASSSVDKELLKAFRYFDRNRAGYIRVEDMRLIIHNLGTFLSHRDVKELVQSALLESNTGRNDRILYNKLIANNRF